MATDQSTKLPPLYAVRTALGLSMQDAAIILNDADHPALKMDDEPSEALGLFSEMVGDWDYKVEPILRINNPDGTLFKEWKITRDGFLMEIPNGD